MDDSSVNIDQQLLNAYQETVYQVINPAISIEIGIFNPILNDFLRKNDAISWAFISAWNPKSQLRSSFENNQRHQELIKRIEKIGFPYFTGKGIGKDLNWKPEISLFILNIPLTEALQIGKYFEQNAIIFGVADGIPQLYLID